MKYIKLKHYLENIHLFDDKNNLNHNLNILKEIVEATTAIFYKPNY